MPDRLGVDNGAGEVCRGEQVSIQRASTEDLAQVQRMVVACGTGPFWPAKAWRAFVEPGSSEGLSAVLLLARGEDGELWGWLAASRVYERSELEYVLVAPSCRGRGVAGKLVDGWIEWAQGQGVRHAALEVRVSNVGALRLYESRRFAEQGRRRNYYARPVEDAVLMGRKL